ncbi:MAG: META domain-containing protein, partial [Ilumatobacteraceae bacterium]
MGREFVSTNVNGFSLIDGTEVHIRFDDEQLSASSGCNMLGGRYSIDADNATSGVVVLDANGLSTTDMGCDPDRQSQDEWLLDLLASRPIMTLTADGFVLADGTTTIDFVDREIVDPDRPLVGTDWTADTILDRDASSSVPGLSSVTFVFVDDGRVVVTSEGCTSVEVAYQRSGDAIMFEEFT